jgi:DNA mismatch endonuclease, patch repair protein
MNLLTPAMFGALLGGMNCPHNLAYRTTNRGVGKGFIVARSLRARENTESRGRLASHWFYPEGPLISRVEMDKYTPAARRENMRHIRSQDTVPELAVRRLLRELGYGYRLHWKRLPGNPDLVFAGRRKVIFVHGCFWHQHVGCRIAHRPRSNTGYWLKKLERNKNRDICNCEQLVGMGWAYLIVWECELKDRETLSAKLVSFLADGSEL